jgi:hypothetical protein
MEFENTREAPRTDSPSAARDLRFAGTIAAGCIAGVLGVGALTAPLLGWTEWPSSQDRGADTAALSLRPPAVRLAPERTRPATRHGVSTPLPGTAVSAPLTGGPTGRVLLPPGSAALLAPSGTTIGRGGAGATGRPAAAGRPGSVVGGGATGGTGGGAGGRVGLVRGGTRPLGGGQGGAGRGGRAAAPGRPAP